MATAASPFIDMLQLAAAGFAEGADVLAETPDTRSEAGRPSLAYAFQSLTSGLIQLEAAAKRYAATAECAQRTPVQPILADPTFRVAVVACADQLDRSAAFVGVAGNRISASLRRFVEASNPAEALLIASQCDTAVRMMKMRAGRAA